MDEQKRESVYIAGSGRINGGVYDVIKIMGSARISGDVEANTIRTAGSSSFSGNVKALQVKTAGSCRVSHDLDADALQTAGTCVVEGDVRATRFSCSGSQRVGGDVVAGEIKISGSLVVGSDVEADSFYSKGRFEVGGLLSADDIQIGLGHRGTSRAGEVGGERIEVRRAGQSWSLHKQDFERQVGKVGYKLEKGFAKLRDRFGIDIEIGDLDKLVEEMVKFGDKIKAHIDIDLGEFGEAGKLEAETIEGDEVYLENTKARIVRGKTVTIGPGCQVERVEYSLSLEVDERAHVGQREKC